MTGSGRVRDYFDRIAGDYVRARYGPDASPWRRHFFSGRLGSARELTGPTPGRVLDLGSGPGVPLPAAEEVFRLDISPAMLRGAGRRSVVADALAIPFFDGSFDTVLALGLTTYVEDPDRLLREIARVLRPGGRLVVSFTRRGAPDTLLRGLYRATLGRRGGGRGVLGARLPIRSIEDGGAVRALGRAGLRVVARRGHNATVFPLSYLFEKTSVRVGRRLEKRTRRGVPPFASDLLLLAVKGPAPVARRRRLRIARVIARLNVGGPARQAILLTTDLPRERYESMLVTGRVEPHEGDLTPLARERGADPRLVPGLGRAPSPLDDLRALFSLWRLFVRWRPDIVHTHTAKAGTLGRIAAALAGVRLRFHTFHGHVLHGYFGRTGSALVRHAERLLARITTRVVAVSGEVADDLALRHRAVPRSRIEVVPLGLPLGEFLRAGERRGELRAELGLSRDALLVGFVGRITAVKEPALAIESFRRVAAAEPRAVLVVAGDGDLGPEMREAARRAGLDDRVRFLGFRHDLPRLVADFSLVLLTSRNEGTPVALIEAAAAGVPAVSTRVGGVPSVVSDGETGLLAPAGDAGALADAMLELLRDSDRAAAMGNAARERVRDRFSAARLVRDVDRLYSAYSG